MLKLFHFFLGLALIPFFLFGNIAEDSYKVPMQLKPRMPEWRLEVAEHYSSGQHKVIHFYAENEKEEEELVKKVCFYEKGQPLEETDFVTIQKEDFEDPSDYDKRYDKWQSTSVPHGPSVLFFDNGKIKSLGSFDRGLLNGDIKLFYSTGQPECDAHYRQDQLDGLMTRYYENGEIKFKGKFIAGVPEGDHVSYYDSGEQQKLTSYNANNKISQVIEWYSNGNEKAKLQYVDGELHSKGSQPAVIKYDEEHNIIETQEFELGVPCNEHIQFHSNGKKKYFAFYIDGEKHGSEKWFDQDGIELGESQYNKGVEIGKHWKKHANGKMAYLAIYDQQGNLKEPILEFNEEGQKTAEYTTDCDGNYQGAYQTWHPNGQLHCDYLYVDGKLDGQQRDFSASGQLLSTVSFQKGVKNGPFKQWYEDGTLAAQGQFLEDNQDGEILEFYRTKQLKRKIIIKISCFMVRKKSGMKMVENALKLILLKEKEIEKWLFGMSKGSFFLKGLFIWAIT